MDSEDFCASGEEGEIKMQETTVHYAKIHEATGGKVQKEKALMCCWKWKNKKTKIMPMTIKVKDEKIK